MTGDPDLPADEPGTGDGLPPRIVFYDGVCALCSGIVKLLIRIDRRRAFRYAPLQGEVARRLRERLDGFPEGLDTMVYLEGERFWLRASGFLRAARHLGLPWRALWWFRWLPAFVTDPVYRLVAATRYRIFGKYEECRLPRPDQAELFLP